MRFIVDDVLAEALVMHVDGSIFTGGAGSIALSKKVVEALNDRLPTTHLGELSWNMGIEYMRDKKADIIQISQTSYIRRLSLLERFNVSRTSPICLLFHRCISGP